MNKSPHHPAVTCAGRISVPPCKPSSRWTCAVLAVCASLAVVVGPASAPAQGRDEGPPPVTEKEFNAARETNKVVVVVQLSKVDSANSSAEGVLLERQSEELYNRTTQPVRIHWMPKTKFIMGDATDVQVGALVHVTGSKSDLLVEARQMVILTGYLKVK